MPMNKRFISWVICITIRSRWNIPGGCSSGMMLPPTIAAVRPSRRRRCASTRSCLPRTFQRLVAYNKQIQGQSGKRCKSVGWSENPAEAKVRGAMPVITVSRLTGSGGATIGQQLADRLGASYLNTQIIQEVAQRLGMSEATARAYDERAEAFIERLSRVLWLANPGMMPMAGSESPLVFESTTQAFVEVTRQLVREAALTGNAVIFGHGAQFI